MKLSEWLEDDRGFAERVVLVDALLTALAAFHESEPGARPALEPDSVEVESSGSCRLEAAGRRLDPAGASYRAPETNEGAPYAPSADTFSAGVLSYQILSGRHPFLTETARGKLESAGSAPATPLRDVQPEVPRDLADAVMACLERDPEWRAKDISYLAEVAKRSRPAGKPGRAARKTVAPEPRAAATRAGSGAAPSFGSLQPRSPAARGSRLPLILGSVAGMLMLVGGLWYFTRPEPPPLASPRPSLAPPTTAEPSPAPVASTVATPTPMTKPTPGPSATPTAAPSVAPATPTPLPTATPTPASVPTPRPTPTARPTVVETPTPAPAATPTPVAAPSAQVPANGPAALSTVVPSKLKRPSTTLLDVRGSGLRPDHKGLVLKGRDVAPGVTVVNQRFVNVGLVQVMVKIDDSAAPGTYQLLLVDAQGQATSPRPLEVTK